MKRRQAFGPVRRVADATLLMGALWTWPAIGQTPTDTTQSASELRHEPGAG